jgi:hypothetical protein
MTGELPFIEMAVNCRDDILLDNIVLGFAFDADGCLLRRWLNILDIVPQLEKLLEVGLGLIIHWFTAAFAAIERGASYI